jgi:hypothetical protein
MKYILLTLAIGATVLVVVGLRRALRTYLKFRGKRLVSCPETHQPAAVRVATGKAAFKATLGDGQLRLSECSRWPEKEACGQECLAQIQDAPKACLVWTIINRWYQGQKCVYCHKPLEKSTGTIIAGATGFERKTVGVERDRKAAGNVRRIGPSAGTASPKRSAGHPELPDRPAH